MRLVFYAVGLCYMLGLLFAATVGTNLAFYFVPVLSFVAVLCLIFNNKTNKKELCAGLLCIALGILSYSVAYRVQAEPVKQLVNHTAQLTATVTDEPYCKNGRYYYTIKTKAIAVLDIIAVTDEIPQNIKLRISSPDSFECGIYDDIKLQVKFKESKKSQFNRHNVSDGYYINATLIDDSVKLLNSKTIPWYSFIYNFRSNVEEKLLSVLDNDSAALLIALLLGDKTNMDTSIKENFRVAGLSHIIVVSGLHLSIISGFIFKILSLFIKDKKIPAGATIAVILIYAVVTGFTYSVIRSAVMNIIYLCSYFVKRKPSAINSLGFAGLMITLFNPLAIGNLSFIMSFLATLGIITLEEKIRCSVFAILPKQAGDKNLWYINKPVAYIVGCASVSLSATLFTLPVMVFVFESFNVYFLLSNIIVTALAPAVIVLGVFMTVILYIPFLLPLANALAVIEGWLCGFLIAVSEFVAGLPMAEISLNSVTVKVAVAGVIITLAIFFVVQGFKIKNTGFCAVVCSCIYAIIMSLGYLLASHFMFLQITDTGSGVAIIDNTPSGINVLACGGDMYHIDNALTAVENKKHNTVVIPDYRMYYSKYAEEYVYWFDFSNVLVYDTDKYSDSLKELLQNENVEYIDENTKVDFCKYSYEIITAEDKNWIYIVNGNSSVLVSPKNADCLKLPEQYRQCDVFVLQSNCSNIEAVNCDDIVFCGKDNGNNYYYTDNGDVVLYKIFNRRVRVWQS